MPTFIGEVLTFPCHRSLKWERIRLTLMSLVRLRLHFVEIIESRLMFLRLPSP